MSYQITEYEFGDRPKVEMFDLAIYQFLKEAGVREMISRHYDLLVESEIKHLFPTSKDELDLAKQNSADFMIQRMGGPHYYAERRGDPKLVVRHQPFPIDMKARIIWLKCYAEAIKSMHIPDDLAKSFWSFLDVFSIWMVNQSAT